MQAFERYLGRWRGAGLIDAETESAIRAFEVAEERPAGRRWQVIIALVCGVILFLAGLLLFVAAHWEDVSPWSRLALVLGLLALLHVAGLAARERFAGFATAMHALGTLAVGAALAVVGQTFNLAEHWPTSVLLWALAAVAGWWLLGDEFQQTLALLLLPAWVISEWEYRVDAYDGAGVYLARIVAVLAVVYLTAFLHSRRRGLFGLLFAVSGVALAVSIGTLGNGWIYRYPGPHWGLLPFGYRLLALLMMLATLAVAWWRSRPSVAPVLVTAAIAFALPWAQTRVEEGFGGNWPHSETSLAGYAMVAMGCLFLAWWGVRQRSKALVNYGMAAFALTVMWFYFSNLMDKLGRSLGLVVLGVLFLAGGWMLETMRRRMMGAIASGGVAPGEEAR